MKNLLFSINNLNIGGAERIVLELVNSIDRNKYKVFLLLFDYKGPLVNLLNSDVMTFNISFNNKSFFIALIEIIKILRANKIDIIHSHLGLSNAFLLIAYLFSSAKRIFIHEHGGIKTKRLTYRFTLFFAQIYLSGIFYVSTHDLSYFTKKDKIFIKGKAILLKNPLLTINKKKKNCTNEGYIIGMVGRLIPEKGHIIALNAFKLIKEAGYDFSYVLYGDGDEKLKQNLLNFAKNNLIDFRIHSPILNQSEIYQSFDILVHPSVSEGFGLVILEALSFSIPVIATATGGIVDIIEDGYNGLLFPPGEYKILASQILRIYKDIALRNQLIDNGKVNLENEYSFEKYLNKLYKYYGT